MYIPAYEDGTDRECSETSAYKIQTPGIHPKESIQHSEHGKSLKSRIIVLPLARQGSSHPTYSSWASTLQRVPGGVIQDWTSRKHGKHPKSVRGQSVVQFTDLTNARVCTWKSSPYTIPTDCELSQKLVVGKSLSTISVSIWDMSDDWPE